VGCSAQLDTKIFDYIQKIAPRRFAIVDEERQLVFGFFMFNHPGDITWTKNPDGSRRDQGAAATRPFSVDVAELFRIKDRQIRKVEALMVSLPYGQTSPFVPKR
jgi:hypothetical protein